ncbi:hypothetical protein SAMN05444166_5132 [Singulisphaera sp. GP187]|nr:hypothetical protein SAMN05444166_5132 [Singulisphaera sp. GP187]
MTATPWMAAFVPLALLLGLWLMLAEANKGNTRQSCRCLGEMGHYNKDYG